MKSDSLLIRVTIAAILAANLIINLCISANDFNSENKINCPTLDEIPQIIVAPPKYTTDGYDIEEDGFTLTCRAAYPIQWDWNGSWKENFVTKRIRRFPDFINSTLLNAADFCYEYILTHQRVNYYLISLTGNYYCASVEDPSKKSSVYKFYVDASSKLFPVDIAITHGNANGVASKVKLSRKTGQNQYVIPCPSNYEKINVTLFKINNGKENEQLPIKGPDVTYNAKIGFLLNANAKEFMDPVGKYKCVGNYGSRDYKPDYSDETIVEIIMSDSTVTFEPDTTVVHFVNGFLNLTCSSINEIQFDTSDISDTKILKQYTSRHTEGPYKYSGKIMLKASVKSKGKIRCSTKDKENVNINHVWKFDETGKCRCLWKNWTGSHEIDHEYGVYICSSGKINSNTKYIQQFTPCKNYFDCKSSKKCLDESSDCTIQDLAYFSNIAPFSNHFIFGQINCTAEQFTKTKMRTPEIKIFEAHFHAFHAHKVALISIETGRTVVSLGNSHLFTCKINSFIMVPEIKWNFKLKSGIMIPATSPGFDEISNVVGENWYIQMFEALVNITSKDIDEVYCFASAWETGEIKHDSIKIYVQDALLEVKDIRKTGHEPPLIAMQLTDTTGDILKWYNITGQDIVIDGRNSFASFLCISPYLTLWDFQNSTLGPQATFREVLRSTSHMRSTPCFHHLITHLAFTSSNGAYDCRHMNKPKIKSSVYLYLTNPDFQLLGHGKHQNLTILITKARNEEWTIIPCRVNDPSADVHLLRQDYEGEVETLPQTPDSDFLKFDPKRGFLVKTDLFYTKWNLSDIFICSSVFEGKENLASNHVITFSIDLIPEGGETGSMKKSRDEFGSVSGHALEAVFVPWILIIIFITCGIWLLLYARRLRKRFENGATMTTNLVMNINGPSTGMGALGEQGSDMLSGSGATNLALVPEDSGIRNPSNEIFNETW